MEPKQIIHPKDQPVKPHKATMEVRESSPLFIPAGMERSVQRTLKLLKNHSKVSTDSEDTNSGCEKRKRHKWHKRLPNHRRNSKSSEESKAKTDSRENETKATALNHSELDVEKTENAKEKSQINSNNIVPDLLQDKESLNKQIGRKKSDPQESNGKSRSGERLRDFYEECVKMSTGLETSLDQHKWFKASRYERSKIRERLTLGPHFDDSDTELELSEESESSVVQPKTMTFKTGVKNEGVTKNDISLHDEELRDMMDVVSKVLSTSDEVEQLVLRNTGVTDELLKGLVSALTNSLSKVTMINLNLNRIGPAAVHELLDLLQVKPEISGLLLFGNNLGDTGVQILLSGVADLQDQTAASSIIPAYSRQFNLSVFTSFMLLELDLGGNGIGSEGLRVLSTFIRYHSHLQYLGLAQTSCSNMEAWNVLFESLKVNNKLTQIILDENNLGDQGMKLFAEALKFNKGLKKIDLDCNNFGDVGGTAILDALASRNECVLEYLSLEGNYISTALMSKLQFEFVINTSA